MMPADSATPSREDSIVSDQRTASSPLIVLALLSADHIYPTVDEALAGFAAAPKS